MIVATTLNGAKACGLEESIGTIEEGKEADLILVAGDPLKDIKILQDLDRIKLVMKGGIVEADRRA